MENASGLACVRAYGVLARRVTLALRHVAAVGRSARSKSNLALAGGRVKGQQDGDGGARDDLMPWRSSGGQTDEGLGATTRAASNTPPPPPPPRVSALPRSSLCRAVGRHACRAVRSDKARRDMTFVSSSVGHRPGPRRGLTDCQPRRRRRRLVTS